MKDVRIEITYPVDFESIVIEVFYMDVFLFIVHSYENEVRIRFYQNNDDYKTDITINKLNSIIEYSLDRFEKVWNI